METEDQAQALRDLVGYLTLDILNGLVPLDDMGKLLAEHLDFTPNVRRHVEELECQLSEACDCLTALQSNTYSPGKATRFLSALDLARNEMVALLGGMPDDYLMP